MLDKRRSRRMNGTLNGLSDAGEFDGAYDAVIYPDIPVDEQLPYVDATPATSAPTTTLDLNAVNKAVEFGGKVYQYVQGRDSQGRTVAIPRAVSGKKPAGNGLLVVGGIIAAILLLS